MLISLFWTVRERSIERFHLHIASQRNLRKGFYDSISDALPRCHNCHFGIHLALGSILQVKIKSNQIIEFKNVAIPVAVLGKRSCDWIAIRKQNFCQN